MGKVKTEVKVEADQSFSADDIIDKYKDQLKRVSVIAHPMAPKKLTKKLYKLIKKANKKNEIRKGVKDVQKFVRKGEKGIVLIAGDTNPIEVICHMPVVCENLSIPYGYIPSKESLGHACNSKRPTCMMLIKNNESYGDLFKECKTAINDLPAPVPV